MRLSGVATPPAHAQFERTGHCKYGDQCRFTHDVQPAKEPAPQKRAQEAPAKDPKYAGRTGNCRYDDQCKGECFHHAVERGGNPACPQQKGKPFERTSALEIVATTTISAKVSARAQQCGQCDRAQQCEQVFTAPLITPQS